jgi:hypothetical protein
MPACWRWQGQLPKRFYQQTEGILEYLMPEAFEVYA